MNTTSKGKQKIREVAVRNDFKERVVLYTYTPFTMDLWKQSPWHCLGKGTITGR
jgi:hypothetical protein